MAIMHCQDGHAWPARFLGQSAPILLVAQGLVQRLPALTWVLLAFVPGCASYNAVSVKDVRPEYLASPARQVKTLDLTKLARPTEAKSRLQEGDVLEVTISNLFEESTREKKDADTFPVRVGHDGTVSLPLLSQSVPIASLTVGEAEQVMRNAYRTAQLINSPQLTVKVLEYKKNKIYVIGAVKKPGMYQLRPDHSDPLRAIAAAEGVTEDAGMIVEIRRSIKETEQKSAPSKVTSPGIAGVAWLPDEPLHEPASSTQEIDLASWKAANDVLPGPGSAVPGKKISGDEKIIRFDLTSPEIRLRPDQLELHNGDIVSVEQKKIRPIYVTGSVVKPGEFPMPMGRDLRVLEAVGMAGGVLTNSEPNNVLLTRRPEGMEPLVVHIVLDRAAVNPNENLSLMEGDVITVVEDGASQTRRTLRQLLKFGLYPR